MAEAEYEESHRCHACGGIVEASYQFCPHCAEKLLEKCVSCKELVQKEWEHCPFCGKNPKKEEAPVKEETSKKKATEKVTIKEEASKTPAKEEKEVTVTESLKIEVTPKKEKTHSIVAEEI